MAAVIVAVVMALVAGYLGFWAGVRRERGRMEFLEDIKTVRRQQRGVRLTAVRVRR